MKREILESANEYFKDYQIDTFIKNNKLYVNMGTCELELSDAEIKYRAKCNDNKLVSKCCGDEFEKIENEHGDLKDVCIACGDYCEVQNKV
jgi:hypothetical protein